MKYTTTYSKTAVGKGDHAMESEGVYQEVHVANKRNKHKEWG